MRRPVRVAILGAGVGGVAMAVRLRAAGFHQFTVFESASGPGGTWWQNTYPGCEVDVPSQLYSFSFYPYRWARTHATQQQLQAYVEEVIDAYGLRQHIRFDSKVERVAWDERSGCYEVQTEGGDTEEFDVVVSSVGMFSKLNWPDWQGLGTFHGPVFHTSQYEHQHDLRGKRVALVGTGSTACQVGPAIAPAVGHLDVYQREPGWVIPKRVEDLPPEARGLDRLRAVEKLRRWVAFYRAQKLNEGYKAASRKQKRLEEVCRRHIERSISDPATRAAVTPNYAVGCKRPIFSSDYYEMFNRPNVTLVPRAVRSVTRSGVVDADGVERPADAIILATGFEASNYLSTFEVVGLEGRKLHDAWNGEPGGFLGITVPRFPNFFMLYGPNTNGGISIIAQLERQANVVVRAVRRLARSRGVAIDTHEGITERYDRWVQNQIADKLSVLATGCQNYYTSVTGKNVTQWPRTHFAYSVATRLLPRFGFVKVPVAGVAETVGGESSGPEDRLPGDLPLS